MAGNASTTILVFSSGSFAAPLPDPLEHPAASIVTVTADAMTMFRVFILAPTDIADRSGLRERLGEHRDRQLDVSRKIIMFSTTSHMANDVFCPKPVSLC